jgi:pimeloyl-ACP methyl ester carboxylesterase
VILGAMAASRVPPLVWSIAEPVRATSDLWRCALSSWATPQKVGDGQPVIIVPGFSADDDSTAFLRSYLRYAGFDVHGWGLGRNLGTACTGENGSLLTARVRDLREKTGRKVNLIGWSLGGLMARDVARTHPTLVRQVIALGCPLQRAGAPAPTREEAPVPFTAIYSRSDGVVHWRDCVLPQSDLSENIEVESSHWGLVTNTDVQRVISDRLAQDDGHWLPFVEVAQRSADLVRRSSGLHAH